VCAAIVATGAVLFASNPLRWPDSAIHSWLLREVPKGSDLRQLKTVAKARGWRINGEWHGNEPHADWGGISGHTIAWIYLGGYRSIFRVDFDSFWAFDEQGRLVDVRLRRMVDAL
jgi:hypothetical protein